MNESRGTAGFWTSKSGIALCAFIAVAALFLIVEHRAHALEWLPYAILLACPLMHLFMHRGHGDHADHLHVGKARPADRTREDGGRGGASGT